MAKEKINLGPGVWVWTWGLWHLLWMAGFFWALPVMGFEWAVIYFTGLYTYFVVAEGIGIQFNNRSKDKMARTLSQWRQFVALLAKRNEPGWKDDVTSWKMLAGGSGVVDAMVTGVIVGHHAQVWSAGFVGPEMAIWFGGALGVVWGITIAGWLVPHFGWFQYNG